MPGSAAGVRADSGIGRDFLLFAGSANVELAQDVARELGGELARADIERFPDGEVSVRLNESVRRREIFVLQPTAPPVDGNLIELLCFADAARRAAADRVTAIVPYLGYSRSDKRHARREAITARLVGDLLETAGVDHVITLDLHAPQIEGFFGIPVDNLSAVPVLVAALSQRTIQDGIVAAPDEGRVHMARIYAERLGLPLAVLHKHRRSGSETSVARIAGDVAGRRCLIVDDIIATGGTLMKTIDALLEAGARPEMTIAATHGLLLPGAREKLDRDEVIEVLVTDTVRTPHRDWPRLRVLSVAAVIAAAVRRFVATGPPSDTAHAPSRIT